MGSGKAFHCPLICMDKSFAACPAIHPHMKLLFVADCKLTWKLSRTYHFVGQPKRIS